MCTWKSVFDNFEDRLDLRIRLGHEINGVTHIPHDTSPRLLAGSSKSWVLIIGVVAVFSWEEPAAM